MKLAYIAYVPVAGGVHLRTNLPIVSVVTVPSSVVTPLASIAVSFTGTPVTLVGIGFCI